LVFEILGKAVLSASLPISVRIPHAGELDRLAEEHLPVIESPAMSYILIAPSTTVR
jgi:hypothetical protein